MGRDGMHGAPHHPPVEEGLEDGFVQLIDITDVSKRTVLRLTR